MKKTVATLLVIVIAVASLHAVRVMQQSYISGKIFPTGAADVVVAINGTDSVKVKPSESGFSFVVSPGNWKILVEARHPYQNTIVGASVQEGQTAQLGEIKLIQ